VPDDMGVEGFLTRKIGPLPVWAYAGIGGAVLGVVFLYRKGSSAASDPNVASNGSAPTYSPSPIVISTPGNMPQSTSSINAPVPSPLSGGTTAVVTSRQSGAKGTLLLTGPSFAAPRTFVVPIGTELQIDPHPVMASDNVNSFYKITAGNGMGMWVWAQDVEIRSGSGGMGGAHSGMVRTLTDSGMVGRFRGRHAHTQWVNTTGMGGKGMTSMARKTGISLVRLQALNPHLRTGRTQYSDGNTRLA
jgi:hypothetical protein